MKTKIFILFLFITNIFNCQTIKYYDEKIVENYSSVGIMEAPFMINELIDIYRKDSLIIKKIFNKEVYSRTKYTLYCYNVISEFFHKNLMENIDNENKLIITRMIDELDYDREIVKPQIDWSKVFETCLNCPFGEYPNDRFFYFKFSIIYMGEQEIKEMIKDSNGEQWRYALMAIEGGDSFTLNKDENYAKYVLDRRIANYVIERWKDCKIKEVQELISVLKSVM